MICPLWSSPMIFPPPQISKSWWAKAVPFPNMSLIQSNKSFLQHHWVIFFIFNYLNNRIPLCYFVQLFLLIDVKSANSKWMAPSMMIEFVFGKLFLIQLLKLQVIYQTLLFSKAFNDFFSVVGFVEVNNINFNIWDYLFYIFLFSLNL